MKVETLNQKLKDHFDVEEVSKHVVTYKDSEYALVNFGYRHKYGKTVEDQMCDNFWDKIFSKYADQGIKLFLRRPFTFTKQGNFCKIVARLTTPKIEMMRDLGFCSMKEGHRFGLCRDFEVT